MTAHRKTDCLIATRIYSFVLNLSNRENLGTKIPQPPARMKRILRMPNTEQLGCLARFLSFCAFDTIQTMTQTCWNSLSPKRFLYFVKGLIFH